MSGEAEGNAAVIAAGTGWSLTDFVCTAGPEDRPFEEIHEGVTVALVRQGSFTYRSEWGNSLLHPGAILLGNAKTCYCCSHEHGVGDLCRSLKLSSELFAEIAATHAASARFRWPAPMLTIRAEHQPPPLLWVRSRPVAQMDMELAALGFVSRLAGQLSGVTTPLQQVMPRDARRISRVLRYMEVQVAQALDLDALASIAAMSKFHFIRVFHRLTGTTPYRYLILLRLNAAARELCETDAAVSTIALDAGFDDLSTFNAAFRRRFGMPPGAYRQRSGQT